MQANKHVFDSWFERSKANFDSQRFTTTIVEKQKKMKALRNRENSMFRDGKIAIARLNVANGPLLNRLYTGALL